MSVRADPPSSSTGLTAYADDETFYPVVEKVGEELLQRLILEVLRPLVERWLAERGVVALTGSDQFIYWRQGDAKRRVAPDLYVLPGVAPDRAIRSWKTWEEHVVPSFALEIVALDATKDYVEAPARYRELGVEELVLFDPHHAERPGRFRFQVFRRVGGRELVPILATDEARVSSEVLGCDLVAIGPPSRLRLATGPGVTDLYPTDAERAERERAEADRERAARLAAEAELARLRGS